MSKKIKNGTLEENIINELLNNNPQFINDKVKFTKIISFLKLNKPDITISNNFKNLLKSRLNNMIEFNIKKTKTRNNFFRFFKSIYLGPIFGLFFVVSGALYLYKDIIFINNNSLINREYINSTTKFDLNNDINSKSLNINFTNSNNKINKNIRTNDFKKEISDNKVKDILLLEESINYSGNSILVDNQIIDFLGDDNLIQNINSDSELYRSGLSPVSQMMITDEILKFDNYITMNFDIFCKKNLGTITIKNGIVECLLNNKICTKSNYEKNNCNFNEKK